MLDSGFEVLLCLDSKVYVLECVAQATAMPGKLECLLGHWGECSREC